MWLCAAQRIPAKYQRRHVRCADMQNAPVQEQIKSAPDGRRGQICARLAHSILIGAVRHRRAVVQRGCDKRIRNRGFFYYI